MRPSLIITFMEGHSIFFQFEYDGRIYSVEVYKWEPQIQADAVQRNGGRAIATTIGCKVEEIKK